MTNSTDLSVLAPPVVVLVETQLAENVGTTIRAMANFGLADLRLVAPRDGWPTERGLAAASRSERVLDSIRVFDTLEEAIADCGLVLAATARTREMVKPVLGPDEAAGRVAQAAQGGIRTAILFGRERVGLNNEEVGLADAILTLPVDPRFSSLNISQSVLIIAYEWRRLITGGALPFAAFEGSEPATKGELIGFLEHFESALDAADYFRPVEKRPVMVLALRGIFQKLGLTGQEVRTLRGVVAALEGRKTRAPKMRGPARTPPKDRGAPVKPTPEDGAAE